MTSNPMSLYRQRLAGAFAACDETAVLETVRTALAQQVSPLELVTEVLTPVLRGVGEQWAAGALTIAEEHAATQLCLLAVHFLRSNAPRAAAHGRRALVACLPEEPHDLGARMFATLLFLDGWDVDFLGARTPQLDLVRFVEQRGPQLVVLVAVLELSRSALGPLLQALGSLETRPAVFVGGEAGSWPEAATATLATTRLDEALAAARPLAQQHLARGPASLELHLATIGQRIGVLRHRLNWSQAELAEASHLDRSYISGVERGKQNPTVGVLVRIADALGVPFQQLLLG